MSGIVADHIRVLREGHPVIDTSSFHIPECQTAAIIGPNGSGKSSILHAIAGILEIEGGTLLVNGEVPEKAREHIAYVLQYMPISPGVPLTVREVVTMGRYSSAGLFRRFTQADRDKISWAMDTLDISTLSQRNIANLSGGQRQRVFVAQALAQDHNVLLLDEPLTGLDVPSAKVIDRIIHHEPDDNCTVVYTTHDLEEARAADYVILVAGRVVAAGAPDDVLTPAHLAEAYGLGTLHPEHPPGPTLFDVAHEDPEAIEVPSLRSVKADGS